MYDVIIIGGGMGGLAAAIYTSRQMLNTLVLEKGLCGGLVLSIDLVENLPGFPGGIKGIELIRRLKEQAEGFGAKIQEFKEVKEITPSSKWIEINGGEYKSRALILACGSIPKRLGVPGELEHKGISYCARCDGPLFKGEDIVVIGGGDVAISEAVFLARFAKRITLIHRREEFRAAKVLKERLASNKNVDYMLNSEVLRILGSNGVEEIEVVNAKTNERSRIPCKGVFVFLGFRPNTDFLKGLLELDSRGYVITNDEMMTSLRGVFACGDCRKRPLHQIVTAWSDGAIAASLVTGYLANPERKNDKVRD